MKLHKTLWLARVTEHMDPRQLAMIGCPELYRTGALHPGEDWQEQLLQPQQVAPRSFVGFKQVVDDAYDAYGRPPPRWWLSYRRDTMRVLRRRPGWRDPRWSDDMLMRLTTTTREDLERRWIDAGWTVTISGGTDPGWRDELPYEPVWWMNCHEPSRTIAYYRAIVNLNDARVTRLVQEDLRAIRDATGVRNFTSGLKSSSWLYDPSEPPGPANEPPIAPGDTRGHGKRNWTPIEIPPGRVATLVEWLYGWAAEQGINCSYKTEANRSWITAKVQASTLGEKTGFTLIPKTGADVDDDDEDED